MLKTSESIGTLPLQVGIMRNQNSTNFDLQHYKMRDKQAEILADGIPELDDVEKICLSHNGISDEGTQKILENLNQSTFDLNISYNSFSTKLLIHLASFLCSNNCNLQILNIEGNRLGDHSIKIFFTSCNSQQIRLKSLNLSKNRLSSSICPSLKAYLECNQQLQELYLYWNRIRGEGGKLIFQAIQQNPMLKVLDLSYNSLGKSENKKKILQTFRDMIKSNKTLLHLDLSFNFFDYDQSKFISDALAYNHSIYGFHFSGNFGVIDGFGYLRLQVSNQSQQQEHFQSHNYYRINSVEIVQMNNYNVYQNCWICEGWVENTFTYINLESGPQCFDPPLLHLELSNYIPMQMKLTEDQQYELKVMTPPQKKIKYFFTVDGNHIAAYDQKRIQNSQIIIVSWLNKQVVIKNLEKLNQIESKNSKKQAYPDYVSIYSSQPRNLIELIFNEKKVDYSGWDYQNSIFRNYKRDDHKLLDEAFEHDYGQSKLPKFFDQNDKLQQSLKILLRQNYELIKSVYKFYSSFNPQKEVWCISQNIFTEFLQNSYILDGKYLTLSSCDFIFIATNAFNKEFRQKLNPERSIIRHQFMEIIVRLADEQYYKSYICEDLIQAIQYFLNHLSIFSEIYINNEQQWRTQYLWTEYVDGCLKFYRKSLQMLFDRFLSRKNMTKPQLLLQDFKNIIVASQIHKDIDTLKEKDVNLVFNMSLQTQISELTSERHLEMNFYEFLEAICRIAEIISPPPYTWEENETQQQIDFQGFPLHIKIESLIQTLARKLLVTQTEKQIKLDVELPSKSIFEEEIAQLRTISEIPQPRIIIKKKIPNSSVQILQNRFKEILKLNEQQINQRKENSQNQTITGVRKNSIFNTALQKRAFKTQSQGQESLMKLLSKPVETEPTQITDPDPTLLPQTQLSSMILQRITGIQKRNSKFASSGSIFQQRKSIILTSIKLKPDRAEEPFVKNLAIQEEQDSQNDSQNNQKINI